MKILSFGEILWDIFGDDKKIGGAPFNFAAHCAKLGAESYLVSAVGDDENGAAALIEAEKHGINTKYIHTLKHKTGVCNVTLNNGKPNYELVQNVAYDHIPNTQVGGKFDSVYMGTLAMRSEKTRKSFEDLLKTTDKKEVLFDVNFRQKFYSRELVNTFLKETTVLKVSDEEIGFFGGKDIVHTCVGISKNYPKLKYICVTLGKDGAAVYDCRKKTFLFSEKPKGKVVSTVGAGDSFAAAFIVNLLSGKELSVCLDRAVMLSDFVVTRLGAVPDYEISDIY